MQLTKIKSAGEPMMRSRQCAGEGVALKAGGAVASVHLVSNILRYGTFGILLLKTVST